MPRTIEETIQEVHAIAKEKGWWAPEKLARARRYEPESMLSTIALVGTELSEAIECIRTREIETILQGSKPHGFHVELADAAIRIFDLVGATGDADAFLEAIEDKIAYNRTRPHRHGNKAI